MIVLVTGATGFIGSQLCRALLAQGHQVRAFHRSESPGLALNGLDVEHRVGDITQPETLESAMKNVDVVFHTAAHLGRRDPTHRYPTTVMGTRNVLTAAIQAKIHKFVHTSSVAALGVPLEQRRRGKITSMIMDEKHTWNYPAQWWPYGHAKYLAELEVQKAVSQGLDAVIVNPAVVIGAGDLNRISGGILIQVARGHIPVSIAGGLNAIHIADVVHGHLAAMESGRKGERYILGNENLTLNDFLRLAATTSHAAPPRLKIPTGLCHAFAWPTELVSRLLHLPIRPTLLRQAGYYFYYDNAKACSEFRMGNFLPLQQAMTEAYDWYRREKYL